MQHAPKNVLPVAGPGHRTAGIDDDLIQLTDGADRIFLILQTDFTSADDGILVGSGEAADRLDRGLRVFHADRRGPAARHLHAVPVGAR